MSVVIVLLGRFALAGLGYLAAALAASAFLNLLLLAGGDLTADEAHWLATGPLVFAIPFAALFIGYFAFLPALAAILLSEALGARDWLFHSVAGAVVALAVAAVRWSAAEPGYSPVSDPGLMMALAGAGMIGGIAYWAVAGRSAGAWRRPAHQEQREPSP